MPQEPETEAILTAVEESPTSGHQLGDVSEAAVAITKYVESAKSTAREVTDIKTSIASALTDSQTKLADIETAKTQALAAKTKIEADQTVIATKSAHIQDAQEHADKVRANLDREQTAATKHATDAEGQKTRAQSAADSITELLTNVRTIKAAAETDAKAIASARETAEESTAITKDLADKSPTIETRIADYEIQLNDLKVQCANQLKTIESLLPGATSAGLAHSFDKRRQTFLKPHNMWQIVFVSSVLTLGAVALSGLLHTYNSTAVPTLEELGRLWLARLPVVGALIWLAVHASREAAQAKRIEEDYGFKAATAACFEGFRMQLAEVGKDVPTDSPLARLCGDTLNTIASPPSRIYEKQKLTATPISEIVEAVKTAFEAVKPKGRQD